MRKHGVLLWRFNLRFERARRRQPKKRACDTFLVPRRDRRRSRRSESHPLRQESTHRLKAKRIRDNSKTIIHTSSSGKKGITVTLGKSPVWPFFCFCIKQGRTGGVTHRYGPFFISGNRAYLSVARNSDTSAVVMSKYITRFSASNSPVTLYRFFGS